MGRHQGRQDRRALQELDGGVQSVLRHVGRLRRHHGQFGRRQPRRVRHPHNPRDLVRIAGFRRRLPVQRSVRAGPEPIHYQRQSRLGRIRLRRQQRSQQRRQSAGVLQRRSLQQCCQRQSSYTNGPLYITGAYEFHQDVNRSSDVAGAYAPEPFANCAALPTALGQQLCMDDTANEDAMKLGIMYSFQTKTTVGVIGERMHRYTPADLDFQNERSRYGTWLVVSQEVTPQDSLHFGWAHAFRSPGNPGQHNDTTITLPDTFAFGGPTQNQADMLTAAWKHKYSENLTWSTHVAATFNGPDAHYDIGAGGRSVTTDCHDGWHQRRAAVLDGYNDRRAIHRPAVEVLRALMGTVSAAAALIAAAVQYGS